MLGPVGRVLGWASAKVHALADLLLVSRGPYARAFDSLILDLIIFSIASIKMESIPDLPQ